jgi:hypothetical protein
VFLNSDTIKKRVISFEEETGCFKDDESIIKFEDIIAFYHQETMQLTNSVYEGTKLKFTLFLKNQSKPYIIEIDSNKKEKYTQIYNLSNSIATFRVKNILEVFEEKKVIEFMTLNDFKLILSKDNILKLEYLGNKNHYEPFVVHTVKMQKNLLIFQSQNKRQEMIYANSISDIALFLQLISKENYFEDESQKIYKKEKKLYIIMMSLLVIFGSNGYFDLCCMDNDFIDIISSLSMIMLGVVILTLPVFWFVRKWNDKKVKNESNNLKTQNYNVYAIFQEDKSEYIFKHFKEDFKAREFVRKQLENDLKFFYYQTNNEFSMLEKYFEYRKYSYKILNDDFDCDVYIKQIAPRVFDSLEQNSINKGFKIFENQEELKLLKDIENSEIISINEKKDFIEIIYKKDETEKYLTIKTSCFMSSMGGIGTYFEFDNKKLSDVQISTIFQDIKKIVKIFHLAKIEPYFRTDLIEIIYKNQENITCSYHLTFEEEIEDIVVSAVKYENIFSFKSKILEDERKTQLDYSYYDEYFCPKYFIDKVDENNNIKRVCYGYYDLDYPLFLFDKKLRFEFDEKLGIKAYNFSSFEYHLLPEIEVYNSLSKKEKERLHHFLRIVELYINDLYVNKKFDNEIFFDTERNPKLFSKIDEIKEKLEKNLWGKKLIYSNAEQGHPATQEIFLYFKDDKKFLYFLQTDWISDWITIKYNNDLKTNLENIF